MRHLTPIRLAVALLGAGLLGAVAPSQTLFVAAHAGLLLGGIQVVRACEPTAD